VTRAQRRRHPRLDSYYDRVEDLIEVRAQIRLEPHRAQSSERASSTYQILMVDAVAAHNQYRIGEKHRAWMVSPASRLERWRPLEKRNKRTKSVSVQILAAYTRLLSVD
jgi:hypothetical protein